MSSNSRFISFIIIIITIVSAIGFVISAAVVSHPDAAMCMEIIDCVWVCGVEPATEQASTNRSGKM